MHAYVCMPCLAAAATLSLSFFFSAGDKKRSGGKENIQLCLQKIKFSSSVRLFLVSGPLYVMQTSCGYVAST
jgi:hypothetical protein